MHKLITVVIEMSIILINIKMNQLTNYAAQLKTGT